LCRQRDFIFDQNSAASAGIRRSDCGDNAARMDLSTRPPPSLEETRSVAPLVAGRRRAVKPGLFKLLTHFLRRSNAPKMIDAPP
jgi:hypothetical protein